MPLNWWLYWSENGWLAYIQYIFQTWKLRPKLLSEPSFIGLILHEMRKTSVPKSRKINCVPKQMKNKSFTDTCDHHRPFEEQFRRLLYKPWSILSVSKMGHAMLPLVQLIQILHSLPCLLSFPGLQECLYHPVCVCERSLY